MGLFGISKFDQAQRYIDDVEVFYERMVDVFKKNIHTRYTGIKHTHSLRPTIFFDSNQGGDKFFFKEVDSLFSSYPSVADDYEIVKKYMLEDVGSRVLNRYYKPKYHFPFAFGEDANSYKSNTLLVIKCGSFSEIDKICKDFFGILDNAFNKANDYKHSFFNNDYQKLYLRLLPIYYRGKGATIWFNYLNKIEE